MPHRTAVAALTLLLAVGTLHAGDDPGPKPLVERLHTTKVTLDVKEQELADVVALLRAQTGINLLIDPRILSDVSENPVTALQAHDLALDRVLDMLAASAGEWFTWYLEGEVAILTSREYVPKRLDVRIYPIAELVTPRTPFLPPQGTHRLLATPEDPPDEEPVQRYGSADELIELVRGAVAPQFWEETEGADIRTLGEQRLVVTATAPVQDEVLAFLTGLENRGPDALRVELHVLDASTLPAEVAATETDVPLRDETALALLGGRAQGGCPSLTLVVRDGVTSTAFTGRRRAFVSAYVPRFAGGTTTPDPQIEEQELGLALRVRAVAGEAEDGRILVQLGVAVADAGEVPLSAPADAPSIALPGLTRTERESTLLLVPGRWHLAEGSTGGTGAGTTAFLVRVTPLDPEREGPPAATPFVVPAIEIHGPHNPLDDKRIVGLKWDEVDLDQVATWIRTISGLNVYLTPRLRAEVYDEVLISLDLADVSLATLLDLVTEPYELRWSLKQADNLLVLDVRDERARDMRLRYFDVKDLTERIVPMQDAPGTHRTTEYEHEPAPLYHLDALVDLIRESIGRYDTWEDPATIEARNGILIVRNEPPVLDALERFLRGLRESVGVVVTTVDQVEVGPDVLRTLADPESGIGCPWLLRPFHHQAIEDAVASGAAKRLGRERIISVQGAGSPKVSGEEIRYVADYDVESHDVSVPVRRVATLTSGSAIGVRAAPGHPGSPVYVEVAYERSVLTAMQPFATPHGGIDLPVTDVWRVATGMRIPDGRTAVVSATRIGGKVRLLLVTPKRVAHD